MLVTYVLMFLILKDVFANVIVKRFKFHVFYELSNRGGVLRYKRRVTLTNDIYSRMKFLSLK